MYKNQTEAPGLFVWLHESRFIVLENQNRFWPEAAGPENYWLVKMHQQTWEEQQIMYICMYACMYACIACTYMHI